MKGTAMNQLLCTCGYQAEDPADLSAHFGEMFTPDDDTAPDSQAHYEVNQGQRNSTETPASATLTCRCGFTGSIDDFDRHLVAVFAPVDRIGLDGNRHDSAPEAGKADTEA
jgi:hypothetical protein